MTTVGFCFKDTNFTQAFLNSHHRLESSTAAVGLQQPTGNRALICV